MRTLVSCLESDMVRHAPSSLPSSSRPPCSRVFVCQMQEDGPASGAFVLSNPVTPTLQAFPRVTNTYGSYQVGPGRLLLFTLMKRRNRKLLTPLITVPGR